MTRFLQILAMLALSINLSMAQVPTLIKNINSDPSEGSISNSAVYGAPYFLASKSGKIFFHASTDNISDFYPYISDGTAAGTIALSKDYSQNNGYQSHVYDPIKDRFYYIGFKNAFPYKDYEIWVSDGTAAGTKVLKEIEPGTGGCDPEALTMIGSKLFFAAFSGVGRGLWVSDGTEAGTTLLNSVIAKDLKVYKGKLYFKGYDKDPNNDDAALWESDGTVAGTKKIYNPANFTKEVAYISPGTKNLYVSIGSQDGIINTYDFANNKLTALHDSKVTARLVSFNNKDFLFCKSLDGGITPNELRETDGTVAGTKSIVKLKSLGFFSTILAAEKYAVFTATDTKGEELWVTNGTAAGTFEIDLNKGIGSSEPGDLVRIGNDIYFSAAYNDGKDYGREPMVTDGTVAGTKLIADMAPGATSSFPQHFSLATFAGKTNLIFACKVDTKTGSEPYKIEIKLTTDSKEQATEDKTLFSIQPNPSSANTATTLSITLKGSTAQLSIYDLQGKIIKKETIQNDQQTIELQNINKGIYIVQIITSDARVKTQKLIMQ